MIKILSNNKFLCEETQYLINLCDNLNENGLKAELYFKDGRYMQQNNIKDLEEFVPIKHDVIFIHDLPIKTISDLYDMEAFTRPIYPLKNKLKYKLKVSLKNFKRNFFKSLYPREKKDFKLVFVYTTLDSTILNTINTSLFDKFIIISKKQQSLIKVSNDKIILLPAFETKNINNISNVNSNKNIAGILSPICPNSNIEIAIKKAKEKNIKQINLYGYMKDPLYYNENLSKIINSDKECLIKYYGPINKSIIYSTVDTIFDYSIDRITDILEKETKSCNIKLYSNINNNDNTNNNIFNLYNFLKDTTKNMREDFYNILLLLKNHKHFAFVRYSDGEIFILQNKELILQSDLIKFGNKSIIGKGYSKEDHKHYEPQKHQFYRKKLIESFQHKQHNYFKGIACKCCVTKEDYLWQFKNENGLKENKYENDLTWANLLIGYNYDIFINEMLPIMTTYKIVFICNEKADLTIFPSIVKEFRVGYNAMINDYPQIEEIKTWITNNKIQDHLFLFAASSFSELAIKELYEFNDKNTYMDIGTALNMFMGMRNDRGYLGEYWKNNFGIKLKMEDLW